MIHLKVLRFDLKSTETHMKTLLLFSCLISFTPTVDVGQSAVTSIDNVVNGSMFWSKRQNSVKFSCTSQQTRKPSLL